MARTSTRETKVKMLFGSGRIDVMKTQEGQIRVRSDKPGTLVRVMGRGTKVDHDRQGYFTEATPDAVQKMFIGLLN